MTDTILNAECKCYPSRQVSIASSSDLAISLRFLGIAEREKHARTRENCLPRGDATRRELASFARARVDLMPFVTLIHNTLVLCVVIGHYSDENYEESSSWC